MVTVFMEDLHGGFLNWSRGPGTSVILAETCQPGNSTPRFLAAQRSAVSSRREEIAFVALAAQHNTRVCGPLCDPSGSSQAMPSLSGASTVLPALSFWIAIANRFAAHSTIKLPSSKPTVFRRRKAFLLCKNPCGGTARAKKFPEEICFAPSLVCQICRTPD